LHRRLSACGRNRALCIQSNGKGAGGDPPVRPIRLIPFSGPGKRVYDRCGTKQGGFPLSNWSENILEDE